MIPEIKNAWRRFRSNFWRALALDVALIVLVFFAVHAWQTRDLPVDEPAPETVLALLDGSGILPAVTAGRPGIVYFFAPWCFYCRSSIGNLEDLVADGSVAWGTVVALDYADADEVQAFIDETGVTLPVLLGHARTTSDWSVRAFPTYYVIDAEGAIQSRAVGYSTKLGMWARYRMAR
jgi:thiol-disulfide isomerase/thioredoxin